MLSVSCLLRRAVLGLVLLGLCSVAWPANAELSTRSKHRKVKNKVGNCIFSTQPLEFEKDDSYKGLSTKFQTGDVVHARCYWPSKLQEFSGWGKVRNDLRDDKPRFRVDVTVEKPLKKGKKPKKAKKPKKGEEAPPEDATGPVDRLPLDTVRVSARGSEEWDQWGYELDPKARKCLFPARYGPFNCYDVDSAVRELARLQKQELPFTAEVCLRTYVELEEKEGKPQTMDIAKGCFDFTSSGPPPMPELPKKDEAAAEGEGAAKPGDAKAGDAKAGEGGW